MQDVRLEHQRLKMLDRYSVKCQYKGHVFFVQEYGFEEDREGNGYYHAVPLNFTWSACICEPTPEACKSAAIKYLKRVAHYNQFSYKLID